MAWKTLNTDPKQLKEYANYERKVRTPESAQPKPAPKPDIIVLRGHDLLFTTLKNMMGSGKHILKIRIPNSRLDNYGDFRVAEIDYSMLPDTCTRYGTQKINGCWYETVKQP